MVPSRDSIERVKSRGSSSQFGPRFFDSIGTGLGLEFSRENRKGFIYFFSLENFDELRFVFIFLVWFETGGRY